MLNYNVLSKKPSVFRNFSGKGVPEFDTLNQQIKEKYSAYEQERLSREDRKRAFGAGHPFNLSLADRFLMLLLYYHLYPSSYLMAYLFGLNQINILKDIRKIEPLVSEVLPLPRKEHDKVRRLETVDEIEAWFPGFKAFLTQPSRRFQDPKLSLNKRHTTAARKKHTAKTQITVKTYNKVLKIIETKV